MIRFAGDTPRYNLPEAIRKRLALNGGKPLTPTPLKTDQFQRSPLPPQLRAERFSMNTPEDTKDAFSSWEPETETAENDLEQKLETILNTTIDTLQHCYLNLETYLARIVGDQNSAAFAELWDMFLLIENPTVQKQLGLPPVDLSNPSLTNLHRFQQYAVEHKAFETELTDLWKAPDITMPPQQISSLYEGLKQELRQLTGSPETYQKLKALAQKNRDDAWQSHQD